jgi:hypothetical protein
VVLQRKKFTSGAEDVVKTHFINVITNVQVVDFQRPSAESIPGLNGIHRCKKLLLFLVQ